MKKLDLTVFLDTKGKVSEHKNCLVMVRNRSVKEFKSYDKKRNQAGFDYLIGKGDIILAPVTE